MYSNKKRDVNDAIDNYADIIVLNPISSNAVIPKKFGCIGKGIYQLL
jgi:hypothetical protein